MNAYFDEFAARERIKEWHQEAEQARLVRLLPGKRRRFDLRQESPSKRPRERRALSPILKYRA